MSKPRLYLAAPLFSEAELSYNLRLKAILVRYFNVYLPQEDGHLFVDLVAKGMTVAEAQAAIFECDCAVLREADVLLLVMDGRIIDEGAAFELGLAYALGKVCCGLQTDPRRLLPEGNNPLITGALSTVFSSTEEMVMWCEVQRDSAWAELMME